MAFTLHQIKYMLYRINFLIVIYLKLMFTCIRALSIANTSYCMLQLQGHSQTSTDVQAHNFYNTLASYL